MRCLHRETSLLRPGSALPSLLPPNIAPVILSKFKPQIRISTNFTDRKAVKLSQAKSSGKPLLCDIMASNLALELEELHPVETFRTQNREQAAQFERNYDALPTMQFTRSRKKLLGRQPGHAVCFNDESTRAVSAFPETSVSCTTFNILAPIYKRINTEGCRESEFRESWLRRNESILQMLLSQGSSIICLQEFWLENEELVDLYEDSLGEAGYEMHTLARTNNRGDGLLTAIRSDRLRILDYRELYFYDCGDRVAQLLHLQSRMPFHKKGHIAQEMLLVNTHLLFPHDSNFCLIRLRQVYKIIEYLEDYKINHKLPPIPVILCGDWNGSKRGHVYKFLRSQGFVSSYDIKHEYTDSDADAHRWVSHRNHRGNVCGVDFIWLLNPNKHHKSLSTSWKEAVFGLIKAKLQEVGLRGRDAFCFFKSQRFDFVTLQEFQRALNELGLTRQHFEGLTREEIEDLMQTADLDGNGVIDFNEFQEMLAVEPRGMKHNETNILEENKLLLSSLKFRDHSRVTGPFRDVSNDSPLLQASNALPSTIVSNISQERMDMADFTETKVDITQRRLDAWSLEGGIGFDVEDASLFPPEVEQGRWPEDYSLSDHAPLTAIFTPVRRGKGRDN